MANQAEWDRRKARWAEWREARKADKEVARLLAENDSPAAQAYRDEEDEPGYAYEDHR